MSMGYVKEINGEILEVGLIGINNNRPFLRIEFDKAMVTNLISGEKLSIIDAFPGYRERMGAIEMVPSESDPDKEYMITKVDKSDPRTWTCSCPDFIFRRFEMRQTCKHVGYAETGEYTRLDL